MLDVKLREAAFSHSVLSGLGTLFLGCERNAQGHSIGGQAVFALCMHLETLRFVRTCSRCETAGVPEASSGCLLGVVRPRVVKGGKTRLIVVFIDTERADVALTWVEGRPRLIVVDLERRLATAGATTQRS